MSETNETLTAPKEALFDYLDSMLQDVSERLEEKPAEKQIPEVIPPKVRVAKKAKPLVKVAEVKPPKASTTQEVDQLRDKVETVHAKADVQSKPVVPVEVKPEPVQVESQTIEVEALNADRPKLDVALPPKRSHEGIPDWAGQNFDCLLFKVSGLSLAVPMVLLGNIHPLDLEKLTPLFHHPDWFIGLLPLSHNRNIKVLDTAQLVMPERCLGNERDRFAYVIGIDNNDWGFACDEIVGSVTLKSTEVKWRTKRSNRPWLAGTVISQMCALIDLQATSELLESAAN